MVMSSFEIKYANKMIETNEDNGSDDGEYNSLHDALLAFQGMQVEIPKDAKGRFTYASHVALNKLVIPILQKLKIRVRTMSYENEKGACVETILCGYGEQERTGKVFVHSTKAAPQDFGGAITYARRYSLLLALNLAPDDDAKVENYQI